MGEYAKSRGWTFSDDASYCEKYNVENADAIAAGRVEAQTPRYRYIHFGDDSDKRDVEGKTMMNSLTKTAGWGAGEFACNDLLYSLEHRLIIDLTGMGVEDAQAKQLRRPVWWFLAQANRKHTPDWQYEQWEVVEGAGGIARWLKFRARGYEPAEEIERVKIHLFIMRSLLTEDSAVELLLKLSETAAKCTEAVRAGWLRVLKADLKAGEAGARWAVASRHVADIGVED